jgi:hypothetical protein
MTGQRTATPVHRPHIRVAAGACSAHAARPQLRAAVVPLQPRDGAFLAALFIPLWLPAPSPSPSSSPTDPLGRMMLTSDNLRALVGDLMTVADEVCGGRLVCAHEGGYR